MMSRLTHFTAGAVVPEQLLPYVQAVSDSQSTLCAGFAAHIQGKSLVLVAYPLATDPNFGLLAQAGQRALPPPHFGLLAQAGQRALPPPSGGDDCRQTDLPAWRELAVPADFVRQVDAAVAEALARPGLTRLTVLAPLRPSAAPAFATVREDAWWELPLPFRGAQNEVPGQKLRNMLRRASRELETSRDTWSGEHTALVQGYLRNRALSPGTRHIFGRLEDYAATPGAVLFSARDRASNAVRAFALGDLSAFSSAFYMFAFRDPACPPGGSDLALAALADAAAEHGHTSLNLGLGINNGIVFFKRKWNARLLFPHVETSWNPAQTERQPGLLKRLFGR